MVKLDNATLNVLMDMLKEASPEKIKRAKLIVEKDTKISQEVKDRYMKAIESIEAPKEKNSEVPENLADALTIDGMSEYIDSIKKEAFSAGAASVTSKEKEDKETEEKDKETEEKEQKDLEKNEYIRNTLIDSITQSAVALRSSEINLEDIEGSSASFKESLQEKSEDDLKKLFKDFSKKMNETFINAPTENLDNDTLSEDSPKGLQDEEKEEKPMSPARKVIRNWMQKV